MQAGGRKREAIGSGYCAAFDEGAGEVGQIDKQVRHHRITGDEIGGRLNDGRAAMPLNF